MPCVSNMFLLFHISLFFGDLYHSMRFLKRAYQFPPCGVSHSEMCFMKSTRILGHDYTPGRGFLRGEPSGTMECRSPASLRVFCFVLFNLYWGIVGVCCFVLKRRIWKIGSGALSYLGTHQNTLLSLDR